MAIVVEYVREYASWAYAICAMIALVYLRVALVARRGRRWAMFGLEREQELNKTYAAWKVAFLLLFVMGSVYLISTVVSEAVQPFVEVDRSIAPTPMQLAAGTAATPTLPAVPETPQPTATATSAPQPTQKPLPTRAPEPTKPPPTAAPAVQPVACPNGNAVIQSPGRNAHVSGMVPIVGSAVHAQFQYYKLEFGVGDNPSVWSYFAGGERPVQGGQLGTLNAGALAPGVYSIRVVVVDTSGNFPDPCITTIVIG
jgi:hypothetical protein